VGELEQAFEKESNIFPQTSALVGKQLPINFENGLILELRFASAKTLLWRELSRAGNPQWTKANYLCNEVRKGVYFVDFLNRRERATTISLALDTGEGIGMAVIGQLPTRRETREGLLDRVAAGRELTSVRASFLHGSIGRPFREGVTRIHPATTELVGNRIEYTYSPTERYEHVYLNSGFYTWHCLAGAERTGDVGLADTDRCHHFKLGDKLYLFSWQEKIIPTHGVVIVDLDAMRTCGKIFGYRGNDFRKLANFPVGARARLLSRVE
jgi:hypothetical protein